MATGGKAGLQSSGSLAFSVSFDANQYVVAIAPSDIRSDLNLFKMVIREREGGGRKSQGKTTKSDCMRWAKCRNKEQVPTLASMVSSYVCKSMRNDTFVDE